MTELLQTPSTSLVWVREHVHMQVMCLSAICGSPLEEYLFRSLVHFFIRLFISFLEMELQEHRGKCIFSSEGTAKEFSKVVLPFYTLVRNVREFRLLHMPPNT